MTNPKLQGAGVRHFSRIAEKGFGDGQNAYAHSMAWYRNYLYVGTTRNNLCLIKTNPKRDTLRFWPVKTPKDVYSLDMRAQIWRYQPSTRRWEQVFVSPFVLGVKGRKVPRDIGYRGMTVFQSPSDSEATLYVSTMSWAEAPGSHVLRSIDGRSFVPVSKPGLQSYNATSFRSLVPFKRRLYVSPAGEGTSFYAAKAPIVLASHDLTSGEWIPVSQPGFGDARNTVISELATFNGFLYAGTINPADGYQIWKTKAERKPPYEWAKVVTSGACRGNLNEAVISFCVFRGALYVGSGISMGGHDRKNNVGPAAAELIRIHPDDTWDLISGTPRLTAQGNKWPLSSMGPGFDNPFCGYLWRMEKHGGYLYVGTFDSSVFMPYADLSKRPGVKVLEFIGIEKTLGKRGGAELWRSADGASWEPMTVNGFGNPYNYGIRNIISTPGCLFVGTANPFGPQVALETMSGSWVYAENPRGGLEVWMAQI